MYLKMIWAILSTFCSGVSSIFRKRSMLLTELKGTMFQFYGLIFGGIPFFIVIILFSENNFYKLSFFLVLLLIIVKLLVLKSNTLEQEIYKKEKFSTLIPFENLQKIFVVIVSFFVFGGTSVTSLIITILAIFVIVLFNVDFKNYQFPKFFSTIIIINLVFASEAIVSGYFLKIINAQTYYSITFIVSFFIICTTLLLKKENLKLLYKQGKKFYLNRALGTVTGNINLILNMYLISKLGMVITVMLSFLTIGIRLILAYFILKETPIKKDLLLTIVLAIFIGVGYYFK